MRITRRALHACLSAGPSRLTTPVAGLLAALLLSSFATAETHTLRAGETIASLDVELKPGDQIVLDPGRHGPLEIAGLRGAAGAPIVVRGSNPSVPAAIQAEEFGIRVRGSSHVVVQDIIVIGGERAAVIVEPDSAGDEAKTSTPSEQITLRRIAIGRTGAGADGIVVRSLRGGRLEQCRIERFGRTAIALDGCSDLIVIDPLIVGTAEPASPIGIALDPGSERIHVSGARVQGGVDVGIAVGVASDAPPTGAADGTTGAKPAPATGSDSPPTPPSKPRAESTPPATDDATPAPQAERPAPEPRPATKSIVIEQAVFRGCVSAIAIGSVDGLLIHRSTFTTPRGYLLRFGPLPADSAAPRDVTIRENLFVWVPNTLKALVDVRPGVDLAGVSLGRNLWWSEEFELFREGLGAFPGRETAPQVTTVDPRLGDFDLATNPDAAGFGSGN